MIQPNTPPTTNGKQLYTQYEFAKAGLITPQMIRIAQREAQTPEFIRAEVARGRLVIPANIRHLAGAAGIPGTYDFIKLSYNEKYAEDATIRVPIDMLAILLLCDSERVLARTKIMR